MRPAYEAEAKGPERVEGAFVNISRTGRRCFVFEIVELFLL
jgi:hypothetical protein